MPTRVPRRLGPDVTPEIQLNHKIYGSSDHNTPWSFAASKSLNYAGGPSLARPDEQFCTTFPQTDRYEDAVGLFGAENKFIRYRFRVNPDQLQGCFEDPGYACSKVFSPEQLVPEGYRAAEAQILEVPTQSGYDQAIFNEVPPTNPIEDPVYISIELINHGTGNIHVDDYLDTRLYTSSRLEWPYSKAYIRYNDFFYVGFHARNTRRLPYNVEVKMGEELAFLSQIKDKRMIMRSIPQGPY